MNKILNGIIVRYLIVMTLVAGLLFGCAGTFLFWQALVFLPMLFVPMMLIEAYLYWRMPELLARRLQTKEKTLKQNFLSAAFYTSVCAIFVLAGLDRRFDWSSILPETVITAQMCFLASYLFLFLVFRENKYLAHTVVIAQGQKVVTSGPYALVRHPMYFTELLMFVFAPLSLGSWRALWAVPALILILVPRILAEEKLLAENLSDYSLYQKKTRYRLIPFVW